MFRPVRKQIAERTLAGQHHQQVETVHQCGNVGFLDLANLDPAAATRKVVHQRRQIDAVIDGAARLLEVAAELQRLREVKEMVVVIVGRVVI